MSAVGSRVQVWHGNAHHTKGGITKAGLKQKGGKGGPLVSKKASAASKRRLSRKVRVPGHGVMTARQMLKIHQIPKKSRRKSRRSRRR